MEKQRNRWVGGSIWVVCNFLCPELRFDGMIASEQTEGPSLHTLTILLKECALSLAGRFFNYCLH